LCSAEKHPINRVLATVVAALKANKTYKTYFGVQVTHRRSTSPTTAARLPLCPSALAA
jgi:hypothetical protein